ncbi:UDP-N-acetylmuramoyl-L-alanine--D-glutamate ligase [Ferrimicrobium sp.]|uniref:UDP-N-acetylmuramoyl-L-alanine--D-glutamate ligase n=1 Tax=Ferrimicrobium sp. TaxID=2926050 RepID=UPI00262B4640|nr:UDP-N-acetylmuramoyl-L-alanine--D-glutamate ligase [Ferrimicrobium sp.]
MNLAGARVLIVGFGISGRGVADALADSGAYLSLAEDNEWLREQASMRQPGFWRSGTIAELRGEAWDLVVVSPGISPEQLGLEPLANRVIGELELGWLLADAPITAITGTNGKTTVATLTQMMLGSDTVLCGNAGVSFAAVAQSKATRYVVEASSFQLTWAPTFAPTSATWTNFTPDHLDWHGTLEAYRLAKAKLFANLPDAGTAILNADDAVVEATPLPDGIERRTFSMIGAADYRVTQGSLVGPNEVALMPVTSLGRGGPIGISNALAAWASADAAGADLEQVRDVLEQFTGLEHRQELVGEANGVRYVNDSKATTPVAAAAGITSFAHVVLIAGGRGKGLSFEPMVAAAEQVRHCVTIGECGSEIGELFRAHGVSTSDASSMREAVEMATAKAHVGDVVLLAPGAASFDWYDSYAQRGLDFKAVVANIVGKSSVGLADDRGREASESPIGSRDEDGEGG